MDTCEKRAGTTRTVVRREAPHSRLVNVVMDASHDQMDHVVRTRLVESCGARDDSFSWNLSRAKQDDTIPSGRHVSTGSGTRKSPKAGA